MRLQYLSLCVIVLEGLKTKKLRVRKEPNMFRKIFAFLGISKYDSLLLPT